MDAKAVLFAGQGAQAVGMARDLAEADPACRALFDEADRILGFPLSQTCFEGPVEELTRSDRCQPGIFVASLACFRALQGACPALTFAGAAGLSLGEWTALHAAGALTFEDTLRALEARGRFMQEACEATDGAMLSVMGLTVEQLETVWREAGVEVANLNAREQTVLSGPRPNVQHAETLAKVAGAKKTVMLNVAGAFHSQWMGEAARRLDAVLGEITIRPPAFPVVSNVTGEPHGGPDDIRRMLVRQVTSPVRWFSGIEWLAGQGVRGYVECGPGRVLSSLMKRIHPEARVTNVQDRASLEKTVAVLETPEWKETTWVP